MRSTILIQGMHDGQPSTLPLVVNSVDEHPNLIEFLEQVWSGIEAIYNGFTGDWKEAAEGIEQLFGNLLKDANAVAERLTEIEIRTDGRVSGLIGMPPKFVKPPIDHLLLSFVAWSEDDLKKGHCFGKVVPSTGVGDLGHRFWDQGDDHYFQQSFTVDVRALATGRYAFGFGAIDDGWFFDVGVVSNVILNVAPASRTVTAAPVRELSLTAYATGARGGSSAPKPLSGGLVPKRTTPRPVRLGTVIPSPAEVAKKIAVDLLVTHR